MKLHPAHFTIGFCENATFAGVSEAVNAAYQPLTVYAGLAETKKRQR